MLPLVDEAADVLELTEQQRKQTIIRMDAGGGSQHNFDQLFNRGYSVLGKIHAWNRAKLMARSVSQWHIDPDDPNRHFGLVTDPIAFSAPTRQVVIRRRKPNQKTKDGKPKWVQSALVTNLTDRDLCQLTGTPLRSITNEAVRLLLFMHAYDKRGGGIETSIREDKQALGMNKRNKRSFVAQEVLMLLTQLAHNLLIWAKALLSQLVPAWQQFGLKRFLRDVLNIPSRSVYTASGRLRCLRLSRSHPASRKWSIAWARLKLFDELSLCLYEI